MCGLAAVLREQPGALDALLEAATDTIRHRGPDGTGFWVNDSRTCGLAHVRLSIIDLAAGQQPLSSPDGSVRVIVNGEFYGFEAIRRDFEKAGYRFATQSDSEILIPLYLKYGEACLEHLRGEFTFVLWDDRRQELLVARDRFGIKPLFYTRHGGSFFVGSEIKALLAMGVPARWNARAVFEDETGYRNCTDTLFRDVHCVPPGHLMRIRGSGGIVTRRYWDFDYPQRGRLYPTRSERAYIEEFQGLLSEAVKLRLRADVPVGAYLSGGIDSSAVLSLMREHHAGALDAFTLAFDHERFDESAIARQMAAHAGVRHSIIDIDPAVLAANFEATVWHDECPFGNSNTIAKYVLSRHVRDAGLKVVLTGEGSDEVLGGYPYFLTDMRLHDSRAPGPRLARLVRRARGLRHSARPPRPVREASPPFTAVRDKLGFVPAQLLWTGKMASSFAALRAPEFAVCDIDRRRFDALMDSLDASQIAGRNPLNQSLYLSSKSMLPNMILTTLGDRVEMAHSIEARLPFLDHKLVEFLCRLPVELKIKVRLTGGIEKYLLKEAVRARVPEILYRRTKHAFQAPPTAVSASDEMAALIADTLHGDDMRNLRLYDRDRVLELHRQAQAEPGRAPAGLFLKLAGLATMQRRFGLSLG